ncbi:unnamed protein product, partial [Iphiclides podalirius]
MYLGGLLVCRNFIRGSCTGDQEQGRHVLERTARRRRGSLYRASPAVNPQSRPSAMRDAEMPPPHPPPPPPPPPPAPAPAPASSPAPSPAPSRLRLTLHSLRSPFRHGSPFHIGSLKRVGSAKSSASDGDIARDERTMRKKIKKQRADTSASSDASRSTDSSPGVDKRKKEGFIRRMGTIGRKRAEEYSPTPPQIDSSPSTSQVDDTAPLSHQPEGYPPLSTQLGVASPPPPQSVDTSPPRQSGDITSAAAQSEETAHAMLQLEEAKRTDPAINVNTPEERSIKTEARSKPLPPSPEPLLSPIAVEHAVATRPFTKEAWKKRTKPPEIQKPVEEPSPGNALKRRIAFVEHSSACLSEDHDDDDDDDEEEDEGPAAGSGGEVGSLEEAVALARVRLAGAHSPTPPRSRDICDTEEEGSADTMPAYGDLIEPDAGAVSGVEWPVGPVSGRAVAVRRARHELRADRRRGRVLLDRVRVLRL